MTEIENNRSIEPGAVELALMERLNGAQAQYGYYVTAAALAAMAFAITYTKGEHLSYRHAFIGAAVVSWGGSAALGVWIISGWTLITRLSLESHRIRRGASHLVDLGDADEADQVILARVGTINARNKKAATWQLALITAGACMFTLGHVWTMIDTAEQPVIKARP